MSGAARGERARMVLGRRKGSISDLPRFRSSHHPLRLPIQQGDWGRVSQIFAYLIYDMVDVKFGTKKYSAF